MKELYRDDKVIFFSNPLSKTHWLYDEYFKSPSTFAKDYHFNQAKEERKMYPTFKREQEEVIKAGEYYKQFLTDIKVVAYGINKDTGKGRTIVKLTNGREAEVSLADDDLFNANEAVLYAYKKATAASTVAVARAYTWGDVFRR